MKLFYCLLALIQINQDFTISGIYHLNHNPSATGGLSVQVIDLTPRFLKFYDTATMKKLDPESRWQLWKKMYGFAAVPPGPNGQKMARTLLDNAWPGYPGVLARIRQGASVLKPSPLSILERVAKLLNADTSKYSIKVILVVFVGGLENNAFTYSNFGVPTVAIPVETNDKDLELTMTHEFTHVVHSKIAGSSGAHATSIAELVFSEGLAMRAAEQLLPGYNADVYLNAQSNAWMKEGEKRQTAILQGIQQHLTDSTLDELDKFTFGIGTTGLRREGYFAGWAIIGELEKQGMTLAGLARLSPASIRELLNSTINVMIKN